MELFYFVTLCFFAWAFFYMNAQCRIRAKFDHFRFRLFALRDELAFEAMKNEIDPNSKEYEVICRMINSTIKFAESYDPFLVIKCVAEMATSRDVRKEVKKLRDVVESENYTSQKRIVDELFKITSDIFKYNTRGVYWVLSATLAVCEFFGRASWTLSTWRKNYSMANKYLQSHI